MSLVDNHIELLNEKYSFMIKALLIFDEWLFLTTHIRLFKDPL